MKARVNPRCDAPPDGAEVLAPTAIAPLCTDAAGIAQRLDVPVAQLVRAEPVDHQDHVAAAASGTDERLEELEAYLVRLEDVRLEPYPCLRLVDVRARVLAHERLRKRKRPSVEGLWLSDSFTLSHGRWPAQGLPSQPGGS